MQVRDAESGVSTQDEANQAVAALLAEAGVGSLEELQKQAESGEFESERARRAWFTLAPLDDHWGSC